ncbi:hypothetical protein ACHAW5_007170 [Stephanodiscus triporus]|uniref:Sulfotransferase n=1 Tax=Stephanodiscus triporus TaxID=2934178 RepID=A0ABD3NYV6_9STRA
MVSNNEHGNMGKKICANEERVRRHLSFYSLSLLSILVILLGGESLLLTLSGRRGRGRVWKRSKDSGIAVTEYSNFPPDSMALSRDNYEEGATVAGIQRSKHPSRFEHSRQNSMHERSRPESMYERLWPGSRLPWWAVKVRPLRHFQPPRGNSTCFVHVGKTAGSSVGCALGFRLHCENEKQYLPGRLPKSATHAFHKDVYDCPDDSDFYLFVLRDPLERSRSAIAYGRPDIHYVSNKKRLWEQKQKIYVDCGFSSASELAMGLSENGRASEECKQRARDMLRGTTQYDGHMFYNYQYYFESIPRPNNILVIRSEHMTEDWNSIETRLGGTVRENITFPHQNSKPKEPWDSVLGEAERKLLCHELCVEIQYYKLILQHALNINETEYKSSMKDLHASCPHEAELQHCDFDTPNITQKLLESRGYSDHGQ